MSLKSKLSRLKGALKLLARSRGHGVHSPLAYSLVCDLLHPDCPYYNQAEADRLARESGCNRRLAQMTFRLACRIDCRRAAVTGEDARVLREVLKLTRSDIDIAAKEPQMVVITAASDPDEALRLGRETVSRDGYIIISGLTSGNRPLWDKLLDEVSNGISLEGSDIALLAAQSHLPRQHYDLWI